MTTLYLHGFLSSPASAKGRLLEERHRALGLRFIAPDLNVPPLEASRLMLSLAGGIDPRDLVVAGSSLGGFYATWLAERLCCRALLVNPAVRPWEFVKDFEGPQKVYGTERTVVVSSSYAGELRELDTPEIADPSRYMVLLSTADEVLDWREADEKYRGAGKVIVEGGDHQVSNFADYADEAARFCVPVPPP